MKKLISIFFAFIFFGIVSCKYTASNPKVIPFEQRTDINEQVFTHATKLSMSIEGMICAQGCAAVIEKNLNKTIGIKQAKVDFETKIAHLIYDANLLNSEKVSEVVLKTGENYSVLNIEIIN
jgi:Cu+-exporting ATPase